MQPHRDEHGALIERVDALKAENAALREELAARKHTPPPSRPSLRARTTIATVLAVSAVVFGFAWATVLRPKVVPDPQRAALPADDTYHLIHWGWKEASSPGADVESISGPFAVGAHGRSLVFDHDQWLPQASPTSADLHAVASNGVAAVAVGATGTIVRFDSGDKTWRLEPSGTNADLRAVSASPNDFYAVGDGGVMLHRDRGSWSAVDSQTKADLRAVYTSPWFALGARGTIVGSTDGATWKPEERAEPTAVTLIALTSESYYAPERQGPKDVSQYAFGSDGTVFRRFHELRAWEEQKQNGGPAIGPVGGSTAPLRASPTKHERRRGAFTSACGDDTGCPGIAMLINGVPWFFSYITDWVRIPAPPEPITRILASPNGDRSILGITAAGRAYELAQSRRSSL